jgi:Glycosyltransferase family 87
LSNIQTKFAEFAPSIAVPLALIAAIGMTLYVHRVLTPFERRQDLVHGVPGGYLGDMYQRWIGTRELLLHRRDPYDVEVTREIQSAYYGRPLSSQEHRDEQRFAYPIFVVFLLAPTIWMPFPTVQYIATLILALATAASVPLWLHFLGWKLAPAQIVATTILVLASPPAIQGLRLQQLGLLVAFLIAASAALVVSGRLLWAGSVLALATIKPQMAALAIVFWLFWAAIHWKQRNRLILGFAATMLVLIGAGEIILPGWIGRFFEGIVAYRQYTEVRSMLQLFAGIKLGTILSWLVLSGTAVFCWQNREEPNQALTMALVATILALPIRATALLNQVLELPGIFLVLRSWQSDQFKPRRGILVTLMVAICWPWLSSIVLLFIQGPPKMPFFAGFCVPLLLPAALLRKTINANLTEQTLVQDEQKDYLSSLE